MCDTMAYNFGAAAADPHRYRSNITESLSSSCPHNTFTIVDKQMCCTSCGGLDIAPLLFKYVMDEEQLQQTQAFHGCAHLPITVDKPNSRIPACTSCGGYLEMRNIYRPSDVILNEHQQSAVKQYASDLLRMENSFHRKFNNDAERKRRQDSGEPTRGSLGSFSRA